MSVEEVEKYKKLHVRAQGEASMLRGELERQSQMMNEERLKQRKVEDVLREKLQQEKISLQKENSKANTEKVFLMQEMQQLKEKVTKLESEKLKEGMEVQELPSKKRKILDQIKTDRNSFPTAFGKGVSIRVQSSETQTEVRQKRRFTLKPVDKTRALTLAYAKTSRASSDVMKTLFEQPNMNCLNAAVSKTLKSSLDDIGSKLPSLPSSSQLMDITRMISLYDSQVSEESRAGVTEVCSKILHTMIKSHEVELLESLVTLISTTWTGVLLNQDITSDILSLFIELASTNYIMDKMTGVTMRGIFRILSLVTASPDHCQVLCSPPDCVLFSILKILHSCIKHGLEDSAAVAGCEAMSSWILLSMSMSHTPGWIDYTCQKCTKEMIRFVGLIDVNISSDSVSY